MEYLKRYSSLVCPSNNSIPTSLKDAFVVFPWPHSTVLLNLFSSLSPQFLIPLCYNNYYIKDAEDMHFTQDKIPIRVGIDAEEKLTFLMKLNKICKHLIGLPPCPCSAVTSAIYELMLLIWVVPQRNSHRNKVCLSKEGPQTESEILSSLALNTDFSNEYFIACHISCNKVILHLGPISCYDLITGLTSYALQ